MRYLYFIPHAAIGGRKGVPAREFFPFQGASLVTQNLIIIPLFVDGQKRYTDSSSWRSYNAQTDMTCFLDLSQDYLRGQSKTVKDMLRECISRLDSGQHHCSGLPVWKVASVASEAISDTKHLYHAGLRYKSLLCKGYI